MNQTEPLTKSRIRRLINLLGAGPPLLLSGLILEGITILLQRWVSIPISITLEMKISLTILLVCTCFFGVFWFNHSLGLVERLLSGGEKRLITDSLYTYVRHPLYAILLAALPPLFIIWFSDLIFSISWIVMYLVSHPIVRLEERELIKTFGGEYEKYRMCVPALIPYKGSGGKRCLEEPNR